MKFDDLVNLVLEANLYNKDYLLVYINDLLNFKNVQKQQIKNWFLKQYVAWYISSKDDAAKNEAGEIGPHTWRKGHPEWAKKPDIMDFYGFSSDTTDFLSHVIDYFNQLDENELNKIYKKPYEVVRKEVTEWDDYLASQTYKGPALKEGIDVETVMKFDNGYRWEKLITQQAYTAEGEMMGHCVGGYCEDENSIIYSLKDPEGGSHVTIQYNRDKKGITQIKGKQNIAPVEKYWQYVKDFITKFNFIVYEDGKNVGMVKVIDFYSINPLIYNSQKLKTIYKFKDSPDYEKFILKTKKYLNGYIDMLKKQGINNEGIIYDNIDLGEFNFNNLPDFSNFTVKNNVNFEDNILTTLKGSPQIVDGNFNCSNNKLTTLEGGPKQVELNFYAYGNQLISLKGLPTFTGQRCQVYLDNNNINEIDINDISILRAEMYGLYIFVRNNPISPEKILELNKNLKNKYRERHIEIIGGQI